MSHIWMRHVTRMNVSCHAYECVMSHIWMRHVTRMNTSCYAYECVMSRIRMRHGTHMNESCRTSHMTVSSHMTFSSRKTVSSWNPMGATNWFSFAPGAKLKMIFWKNFIKYPKTKRCCFGRFMLVFSNADEKPLSFGSVNKPAVSITCSRKNWNHKQSASFSEILWDLSKRQF